jgi:hypothetical protein
MAAGRKIEDEREARACLKAAKGENLGRWARAHGIDGRSLNAWRINLEARAKSTSRRPPRTKAALAKAALAKAALAKAAPAKSTQLVEFVPRSRVELVVPTSARYVVRIEGAELEVGDDFDAETVARLVRVLRSC